MSEPTRGLRAMVIALCVTAVVASLTGAKAERDNPTAGLKIAVVNPGDVLANYKYTIAEKDDLEKQRAAIQNQLQVMAQNFLLPEADQKTLADLTTKENTVNGLNGAEKTQKQKLMDNAKRLQDEYNVLQTKQGQQLSEQELNRLKELSKQEADTKAKLQQIQDEAQTKLQQQADAARAKMDKDVRTGIIKVAKEKGYNLVFSSEVVLYAENDITQAVTDQINK